MSSINHTAANIYPREYSKACTRLNTITWNPAHSRKDPRSIETVVVCVKFHKSCASLLAFATVSRCAVDGNLGGDTLRLVDFNRRRLGNVCLFLLFFVFTSFVLRNIVQDVFFQDAHDQIKPEQVDGLEAGKKSKRDVLTDPALVLLSFPVELKGTHGSEFSQDSPEDLQVDIMPQIDPYSDEQTKIRTDDRRIEVIQSLGCLIQKSD